MNAISLESLDYTFRCRIKGTDDIVALGSFRRGRWHSDNAGLSYRPHQLIEPHIMVHCATLARVPLPRPMRCLAEPSVPIYATAWAKNEDGKWGWEEEERHILHPYKWLSYPEFRPYRDLEDRPLHKHYTEDQIRGMVTQLFPGCSEEDVIQLVNMFNDMEAARLDRLMK